MNNILKASYAVIGAVIAIILVGLLTTLPLMWLWNWLMPEFFGLKELGFWQAMGLSLLSSILFKNNSFSKSE